MAILFGSIIRIYFQENANYILYNEFNHNLDTGKIIDQDIINMLFINNNYFELIIKDDYKKISYSV